MTGFVLAIDQGTTNTKALALDEAARVAAIAAAPTPIAYPRPGWVEQSGEAIWAATQAAIEGCLAQLPEGAKVAALGVSNQRESVMLWRRSTGETIGPVVTWQCRRSAERLARLRTPEIAEQVLATTGLGLDPLFPAAKLGWLLDAYPQARALAAAGDLCAGTIDSWLVYKLTGGEVHATDAGNASRTQLFDIHAQAWSDELCALFDVPSSILPEVRDSDASFGATASGVPIRAVMGDSHAALFGHGVRAPGAVKATYGTGSSLMTLTPTPLRSRHGLSTTVAWRRGGVAAYALEGNILVSTQAAAWMAELMGLEDVAALTALAAEVVDAGEVSFVPALAGLGAPHWDAHARAVLSGMTLNTGRAHIARATLEAIAHQIADVFEAMQLDLGAPLQALRADGGPTRNDLLMRIQADILGRPVQRSGLLELSAFGAGAMAAIAAGFAGESAVLSEVARRSEAVAFQGDEAGRARARGAWKARVRAASAEAPAR